MPGFFLATSSFTASGWEASFYPVGVRSRDFLRHYSGQFQTVEIDSTFYGTPAASTVTNWNEKTPGDFVFAVKVPQVITHEKALVDTTFMLLHLIAVALVVRKIAIPLCLLRFVYRFVKKPAIRR